MNNTDILKRIERVNFWTDPPMITGLHRSRYLDQVKTLLGSNLIKVLVGQRRSGKSVIIKQMIHHLMVEKHVPAANILYVNMELEPLHFINHVDILSKVVTVYTDTLAPTGKVYLFFDEIQEVDGWEKLINSYLADDKLDCELMITGSNSNLLSQELASYLTGRYIEISVFPFSFHEYSDWHEKPKSKDTMLQYLQESGLPELFNLQDPEQRRSYLSALKDSIVMKDIVKRYAIKNPSLLLALFEFLIDNIGNLFSFQSFCRKINSEGHATSVPTLSQYIRYLETAFLINGVSRFDIKGKKRLEGEKKYYLNDLGFQNYLFSQFDPRRTKKLENYVFNVLNACGYRCYVGSLDKVEIDFIAEKNQKRLYIQVAYVLSDEAVIAREYGNLEKIADNWPKLVVSLDDIKLPDHNGIKHIHVWELEERLLALT